MCYASFTLNRRKEIFEWKQPYLGDNLITDEISLQKNFIDKIEGGTKQLVAYI